MAGSLPFFPRRLRTLPWSSSQGEGIHRIENLNFDLHRGFLAIGLRRNFRDHSVVLSVRKSVNCDHALLPGAKLGEIVLRDVEFDLDIMQVGKRNNLTLWAAFSLAGELRRNQLTSFRGTLQNGARDRSSD